MITQKGNRSLTILETNLTSEIRDEIVEDVSNITISNFGNNTKTNEFSEKNDSEVEFKNILKEQQVEKGRQSKLLATFQREMLIDNLTAETKNLLARSAVVSINTDDGSENDLSSEALTVKVKLKLFNFLKFKHFKSYIKGIFRYLPLSY